MGIALSAFDWFIPSITGIWSSWPPDPQMSAAAFGLSDTGWPILAWSIAPLVAIPIAAFLFWWNAAFVAPLEVASRTARHRNLPKCGFIFMVALLGACPIYVLAELLTPDPIPETKLPAPNAYDDFVAAGKIVGATQFDGTLDVDAASTRQLAAEVAKCDKAYALVADALDKPCLVPVDYSSSAGFLPTDQIISMRTLARALRGRGRLAEQNERYADAADSYLQAIRFGCAARRGGLLIDALVGMACSGMGIHPLYQLRGKLASDEVQHCIAELVRLDVTDETYADFWYRDRVWSQRALGWHGYLQQLLSDLVGHVYDFVFIRSDQYAYTFWTHQAAVRLLIVELAVTQFHRDHHKWPDSLADLVPAYLSAIPIDPLDPEAGPIKYRRIENGYVVYSVGANRIDENGKSPNEDDLPGLPQTGDLQLDVYFAPDKE